MESIQSYADSRISERSGKRHTTIGYYLTFVSLGLVLAVLGPTLPGLAAQTNAGLDEIAYLFTTRSIGALIGAFVGGRLYGRVAGHTAMAGALGILVVLLAVIPFVSSLWALLAVFFSIGLTEVTLHVGGNTLLVWLHRRGVGPYMTVMHFCFGVGALVSPIIVAQAVAWSGEIRWAYWMLALLMAPAAFWLRQLPSPTEQQGLTDDSPGRINSMLLVVLMTIFLALYVSMEAGYSGWVFTYAVSTGLEAETAAAYLTSAFWAAITAGRLFAIPLAARVRPRTILFVDLMGALLSMTLVLLFPGVRPALWAGTIGLGLSLASIFPTAMSFAERHTTMSSRVTGWFFVGTSIGSMILPWLIGQMIEAGGPSVVTRSIAINVVGAVVVFALLMRHVVGSPSEPDATTHNRAPR